jgi:hypothetical protein
LEPQEKSFDTAIPCNSGIDAFECGVRLRQKFEGRTAMSLVGATPRHDSFAYVSNRTVFHTRTDTIESREREKKKHVRSRRP